MSAAVGVSADADNFVGVPTVAGIPTIAGLPSAFTVTSVIFQLSLLLSTRLLPVLKLQVPAAGTVPDVASIHAACCRLLYSC